MTGKRYYISTLGAWQRYTHRFSNSHWLALKSPLPGDNTPDAEQNQSILLLVEGDEGAHLSLEDDPAFEPLPHPLASKPISDSALKALGSLNLPSGATTFDVAEAVARFHPLLRHRVF